MNLLRKAAELGDKLIVGVSTDEFNTIKGKRSQQPYVLRSAVIKNLPMVDMVISEYSWDQKSKDIKEFGVDVLVMGDDWKGKFDEAPCEVVYLPRTEHVSSSELKDLLK